MEKNQPLISIIIPIYNVENYIKECLNSVSNQTYKNLEILCINDGSLDNSLNITKHHSNTDNRIKIINQDNKGLSAARNTGLRNAIGEYIFFLDSDDILLENAIEKLVETATSKNQLIVTGAILVLNQENKSITPYKKNRETGPIKLSKRNFFQLEIMVWNKLYHKSVIDGLTFTDGLIHEDEEFYWKVFSNHRMVYRLDENVIIYRKRANSITSNKYKSEKYQENYIQIIKNAELCVNKNKELYPCLKKCAMKFLKHLKKNKIPHDKYENYIHKKLGITDSTFSKLKTKLDLFI